MAIPQHCAAGLTYLQPAPFGEDAFHVDAGKFAPSGSELVCVTEGLGLAATKHGFTEIHPENFRIKIAFTWKSDNSAGSASWPVHSQLVLLPYAGAFNPSSTESFARIGFGYFGGNVVAVAYPGNTIAHQQLSFASLGELVSGTMEYWTGTVKGNGLIDLNYSLKIPGKGIDFTGVAVDAITLATQKIAVYITPHWTTPNASNAFHIQQFEVVGLNLANSCLPEPPTLLTPADDGNATISTPTLTWQAEDGALSYRVQVSASPSFASPIVDVSGIEATSLSLSGITQLTPGTWYWRALSTGEAGDSEFSDPFSFTALAPVAEFGYEVDDLRLSVAFSDESLNDPIEWAWNFGDPNSGSRNLSTEQNPTHRFTAFGTYTVRLTVFSSLGESTVEHTVTVTEQGVVPSPITNHVEAARLLLLYQFREQGAA